MIKNFIRDYFSYSKIERNGIIFLLTLILLITGAYLLLPFFIINQEFDVKKYESKIRDFELSLEPLNKQKSNNIKNNPDINNFEKPMQFRFNKIRPGNDEIKINKQYPSLNINRADAELIKEILGTDSLLSERIVKYRNLLGGFVNTKQLNEVYGFNINQYNLIINNVLIDTVLIRKININKSDEQILGRHPYLNKYYARAIIKYRKFTGRIRNINELSVNNILPENIFSRIRPYLSVN